LIHAHLIAFTALRDRGTEHGIARVLTYQDRPSWNECAEQIPGYVTGSDLGPAPLYTLRYTTDRGISEKRLDRVGIERVGTVVMRVAEREKAWDVQVLDSDGGDITFNFACFCV
jgi:hypothetical protein